MLGVYFKNPRVNKAAREFVASIGRVNVAAFNLAMMVIALIYAPKVILYWTVGISSAISVVVIGLSLLLFFGPKHAPWE
jgi:hypothetical protein